MESIRRAYTTISWTFGACGDNECQSDGQDNELNTVDKGQAQGKGKSSGKVFNVACWEPCDEVLGEERLALVKESGPELTPLPKHTMTKSWKEASSSASTSACCESAIMSCRSHPEW